MKKSDALENVIQFVSETHKRWYGNVSPSSLDQYTNNSIDSMTLVAYQYQLMGRLNENLTNNLRLLNTQTEFLSGLTGDLKQPDAVYNKQTLGDAMDQVGVCISDIISSVYAIQKVKQVITRLNDSPLADAPSRETLTEIIKELNRQMKSDFRDKGHGFGTRFACIMNELGFGSEEEEEEEEDADGKGDEDEFDRFSELMMGDGKLMQLSEGLRDLPRLKNQFVGADGIEFTDMVSIAIATYTIGTIFWYIFTSIRPGNFSMRRVSRIARSGYRVAEKVTKTISYVSLGLSTAVSIIFGGIMMVMGFGYSNSGMGIQKWWTNAGAYYAFEELWVIGKNLFGFYTEKENLDELTKMAMASYRNFIDPDPTGMVERVYNSLANPQQVIDVDFLRYVDSDLLPISWKQFAASFLYYQEYTITSLFISKLSLIPGISYLLSFDTWIILMVSVSVGIIAQKRLYREYYESVGKTFDRPNEPFVDLQALKNPKTKLDRLKNRYFFDAAEAEYLKSKEDERSNPTLNLQKRASNVFDRLAVAFRDVYTKRKRYSWLIHPYRFLLFEFKVMALKVRSMQFDKEYWDSVKRFGWNLARVMSQYSITLVLSNTITVMVPVLARYQSNDMLWVGKLAIATLLERPFSVNVLVSRQQFAMLSSKAIFLAEYDQEAWFSGSLIMTPFIAYMIFIGVMKIWDRASSFYEMGDYSIAEISDALAVSTEVNQKQFLSETQKIVLNPVEASSKEEVHENRKEQIRQAKQVMRLVPQLKLLGKKANSISDESMLKYRKGHDLNLTLFVKLADFLESDPQGLINGEWPTRFEDVSKALRMSHIPKYETVINNGNQRSLDYKDSVSLGFDVNNFDRFMTITLKDKNKQDAPVKTMVLNCGEASMVFLLMFLLFSQDLVAVYQVNVLLFVILECNNEELARQIMSPIGHLDKDRWLMNDKTGEQIRGMKAIFNQISLNWKSGKIGDEVSKQRVQDYMIRNDSNNYNMLSMWVNEILSKYKEPDAYDDKQRYMRRVMLGSIAFVGFFHPGECQVFRRGQE